MNAFKLESDFSPRGDQRQAIDALTEGVCAGKRHQVLLGVTGSGKTFTMANVTPVCVQSFVDTIEGLLIPELSFRA